MPCVGVINANPRERNVETQRHRDDSLMPLIKTITNVEGSIPSPVPAIPNRSMAPHHPLSKCVRDTWIYPGWHYKFGLGLPHKKRHRRRENVCFCADDAADGICRRSLAISIPIPLLRPSSFSPRQIGIQLFSRKLLLILFIAGQLSKRTNWQMSRTLAAPKQTQTHTHSHNLSKDICVWVESPLFLYSWPQSIDTLGNRCSQASPFKYNYFQALQKLTH